LLSQPWVPVKAQIVSPLLINIEQVETSVYLPLLGHVIKHLYLFKSLGVPANTFLDFTVYIIKGIQLGVNDIRSHENIKEALGFKL
jgi:hypothetical protein